MINVALPKGRLGERAYEAFASAGYDCPAPHRCSRRRASPRNTALPSPCFQRSACGFSPKSRGAADVGVAGRDILLEYEPDVYELLDLGIGRCRMCVAGPENFYDAPGRTLRVATKFPHITAEHYTAKSRDIDIIKLNGSIELAPILGLSDVIVDIVETGKTLLENHLAPLETIVDISAWLISSRVSYQFKHQEIAAMQAALARKL